MMRWGLLGCSLIVFSFALGLPWGATGVACAIRTSNSFRGCSSGVLVRRVPRPGN